jgi:hypothetical protein
MYRKRRMRTSRRRRATALVATAAALVVSASLPTLAFGQATAVDGLLKTLGLGGTSGTTDGSGEGAGEKAGVPPSYEPPLHGSNPHGQGSGAVVDITPENSNPYPGDPGDGDEEVIVGDSRGEQNADGSYQGTVTLAYLLGSPIIQVQTGPGESEDGPLQPLQDGLDQLCTESGDQLCLTLLGMHSSTTDNSSTNSFQAVGAHIGGEEGINADVLTSNGNISDDGTCQTSHGDSSVATASIGGDALTADALQGSSTSTACNDGSQSVQQDSTVVNLGGQDLPLPAEGCADGTPNTVFDALSPLVATVCNGDDTNGAQTNAPYGVREALTVFALINGDTSVVKATTAGPESHAAAPGGGAQSQPPPPPSADAGGGGGGAGEQGAGGEKGAGGEGDEGAGGGGGAAGEAAAGDDTLAFTGADLLLLGLVGGVLILGGLALTTTAGRRHRQTV